MVKPLPLPPKRFSSPSMRAALRLLNMVHELHKVGYQRLRIASGLSPTGCHWRCKILPADYVQRNGWKPLAALQSRLDSEELSAGYTTGQGADFFRWGDTEHKTPRQLATKFVARFPHLAEAGIGLDWGYAGWFTWMLGNAEAGHLPVFFAEWEVENSKEMRPPPP